jgi:sugar/nucleoside kinase (ribokinase family)
MTAKKIITFGNPVYDEIQTPKIRREDRVLSGCSTNASLVVSRLGEHAVLVGTIGKDFEARLRGELEKYGIENRCSISTNTGGFKLNYDERGDRELEILGIADPIPQEDESFEDADFILFGPILGEISPEFASNIKSKYDAPVIFDPQGSLRMMDNGNIIHRFSEEFRKIAGISTIVKANELEAKVVTGIDARKNPVLAVKKLYEFGCEIAIVTLGDAGSIIFDGTNLYEIPPYQVDAIDPTGAGDTYAAGFMIRYLETPNSLQEVGCYASCVASIMVENSGPDFSITRQQVQARFEELINSPQKIKLN